MWKQQMKEQAEELWLNSESQNAASVLYPFLGENYLFSLLCEESQDTKVSTARYINVGCVNIPALLFCTQTQEAEKEMLLSKHFLSL